MLGLGYEIGSDKAGVAVLAQDSDLCGPCQEVDAAIKGDKFLGRGYKKISRANDLVYFWNRCGSIGQSGNCMSAADAIELADAEKKGGCKRLRGRPGRDNANLRHGCDLRRDDGH